MAMIDTQHHSMDIQVTYQIGLKNPRKKKDQAQFFSLPPLTEATAEFIGSVAEWAGSYHILAMGRHFRSYVLDPEVIRLCEKNQFPYADSFTSLRDKSPSSTVTGNIGQTLTALYAKQFFKAKISDIIILDPKARGKPRKTPDFLFKIESLNEKFPSDNIINKLDGPLWWPVECKARKDDDSNIHEAKKEAFLQLLSFWTVIQDKHPDAVGYGIISIFINSKPPALHLIFIIPCHEEEVKQKIHAHKQKIREYEQRKIGDKNKSKEERNKERESLEEYSSISKSLDVKENFHGF
jgi:hypothetical protein